MPKPDDLDSPTQTIDPGDAPIPARFRVTLQCPTPLTRAELEVEAPDEAAAWLAKSVQQNEGDQPSWDERLRRRLLREEAETLIHKK